MATQNPPLLPERGRISLAIPRHPERRVLIVEPKKASTEKLEKALKDAGHQPVFLTNVEQALAYIQKNQVAVILTDLFLPHRSGLKLLRESNRIAPQTAVIITATDPSVETAVAALRGGAADYLVNPLPPEALCQAIERVMSRPNRVETNDTPSELIEELETLRAASELFLKNLSQEEVLSIIGDRALKMSQVDYCEIYTTHPDGKAYISAVQLPSDHDFSAEVKNTAHGLAIQAIKKQENLVLSHAQTNLAEMPTWLAFPLKVGGSIVGALCLGQRQYRSFSPSIIKLLSIFADQASIAISNAYLFEDLTQAYSNLSRSRTEILESRNTLQTLFDGITDGLYIIDQNLNVIMINQAEINHLQQPGEQILGQTLEALGWAEAAPAFLQLIQQTFQSRQKADWMPADPNPSPLIHNREMHLYPIISPQEDVQQVIILAQDVASQKKLQASLFQSANLAAVGQLATSVAHEINNPLTIALTNAQLAMVELEPSDEIYEMTEDIYYACNRIKDIVNNLVDFSNQDIYQFEPVNLIETIEDTLLLIGHPLRKAKIEVERIYRHTPTITASRSHLKMAWMNLLLNACEAIKATEKPGRITISTTQTAPDQVTVSIEDTGMGISDPHIEHIFTPFFTTKPVGQALGLGLFTTRTIIEKHHGAISLQNTPRRTVFTIILPDDGE